jgi:hypothetical protein
MFIIGKQYIVFERGQHGLVLGHKALGNKRNAKQRLLEEVLVRSVNA